MKPVASSPGQLIIKPHIICTCYHCRINIYTQHLCVKSTGSYDVTEVAENCNWKPETIHIMQTKCLTTTTVQVEQKGSAVYRSNHFKGKHLTP